MATNFDVLVVGAGPVGLFLARELVRHGGNVGLVEMKLAQSEHSKALAIMPRTLEVFEMAGVLAPFEAVANRVTRASIVAGRELVTEVLLHPEGTRFPYLAMVPQDVTERILLGGLREAGGDVRYGTQVTGFDTLADGTLEVTLKTDEGTEQVTAKYLVGCDGAHSVVRKLSKLPFEGSEYPEDFVLADLETSGPMAADVMQLCPHPDGAFAIFPLSATRCRLVAMASPEGDAPVTLPFVNALLEARGSVALRGTQLLWGSRFRIHHREAAKMQAGNVFLAGDAAHIHSPFGGQGMNTGLQDAWNLAWKLRVVLEGIADSALLETYSKERHPVVHAVVRMTHAMTRGMTARGAWVRAVRNMAMRTAMRTRRLRNAAVGRLTQLDVGYPGAPRVADEMLVDGTRLYGPLGRRFVLSLPEGTDADSLARFGKTVEVVRVRGAGIRLIRPDGYLALDAGARGLGEVAQALRRLGVKD